MTLSPPARMIPGDKTADATAISSAVSPDEGVTTSPPRLNREPGASSANVPTSSTQQE